jgi:N utilization substance protein A
MGSRVRNVMTELHGEKIDIVDYADDPAEFVANALSPARVSRVDIVDPVARIARVTVPDYQLSLAIGKEGQNARLAAKLTGWKIDIVSDTAVRPESTGPERAAGAERTAPESTGSGGVAEPAAAAGPERTGLESTRSGGAAEPAGAAAPESTAEPEAAAGPERTGPEGTAEPPGAAGEAGTTPGTTAPADAPGDTADAAGSPTR